MTSTARPTLIRISCRHCHVQFNVDARHAGKTGTCPNADCKQKYRVPSAGVRVKVAEPQSPTGGRQGKPARTSSSKPNGVRRNPRAETTPVAVPGSARKRMPQGVHKSSAVAAPPPPRPAGALPAVNTASGARRCQRRRPGSRNAQRWWLAGGFLLTVLVAACWLAQSGVGVGVPQQAAVANAGPVDKQSVDNSAAAAAGHHESPATDADFHAKVKPFMAKYCYDCHGNGLAEGDIAFDNVKTPDDVLQQRARWERALTMISSRTMPPVDHDPRPTAAERNDVETWLDSKLFYVNCGLPTNPGRVTMRRLNRAEYNNTIRDLVGVDFNPAADFPSDEVGYGFDNIGDVLSLPPLLFEKYVSAAEEISQRAIVGEPQKQLAVTREGAALRKTGSAGGVDSRGFITMASNGSVYENFAVPAAGEYTVSVEAMADQAGGEPARVVLRLNDKEVKTFDTQGQRKAQLFQTRVKLRKGKQKLEAAFENDFYDPKARDRSRRDRNLAVRFIRVEGPQDFQQDSLPESHQRIVQHRPDKKRNEDFQRAAKLNLQPFLTRAFRRPATDEEVERFLLLIELAEKRGDTFEQAMQLAVQGALVSPHFLFRIELHPRPDDPQQNHQLGDYALASRLSYFLWSSMPDQELFDLAKSGKLQNEQTLREQTARMLADPRAESIVENFATQWLNLRNLDEITPDPDQFPDFSEELRSDMQQESQEFFAAVMRENGSILDFLDGKYTFVNERLAKYYGIGGVKGDEFRRVSLNGTPRAGVLTHASILTLTSNPGRTSPVKRGKWIMENILGTPPPPAPMGVPELEETIASAPDNLSLREQMELHRKDPGCAACHVTMDAIGFGFENFDAVGRWRDKEGKVRIDAAGELPGSGKFSGPMELVQLLKSRDHQFRRAFVEKLLTYALGRGLEYYDRCTIDAMCEQLKQNGDHFHALVEQIVLSDSFRKQRGEKAKSNE